MKVTKLVITIRDPQFGFDEEEITDIRHYFEQELSISNVEIKES